jgi:uncharacterized protein (DUF362 family)/Pyruvate/2-oxoacid:ferredoxin oxidoreductase delta subunit
MSDVLVLNCPNYLEENVDSAVSKIFKSLDIKIKPKSKVLIKPNILMAKKPEEACSTHPSVIDAICKELQKLKCEIIIGESGGWNTAHGFELSGIKAVGEKYSARIAIFENEKSVTKKIDGKILSELKITSFVDDVDYIINVPKMKTHMLMRLTGAVKNIYGLIPGMQKAVYHTKGKDEIEFGELLIDLYSSCKDKIVLNIMDAIVGMEGQGPGNGDPKNTGLILASIDALALDVIQSKVMGIDPRLIQSTNAGIRRGYLEIEKIKVLGDYKLASIPNTNYHFPGHEKGIKKFIDTAKAFISKKGKLIPEVNKDKCIKCAVCAKLCPVHCITLEPYPTFERKVCINCYCCHEHCPKGAIFLKR